MHIPFVLYTPHKSNLHTCMNAHTNTYTYIPSDIDFIISIVELVVELIIELIIVLDTVNEKWIRIILT